MAHFDELFKHLADYAPSPLAALALNTPNVEVGTPLNTEQVTVRMHHSDMAFQVWLPDRNEEAILHIEAQTDDSREKPMPLRVLMYSGFLAHQHEKNVYSAVFYFRPPAGQTDLGVYEYGNAVMGGLRLKYNVIRMYELEGEAFLDPNAVGILPFTPLMRPPSGMTSHAWVETCIEMTKAAPVDNQTRGTLLYALSVFGGLVHPPEFFQDPVLEAIMQESPIYERVIQRGIEQGIEQGARQTMIENILAVLEARFTDAAVNTLIPRLEAIEDLNRLKQLNLSASLAKSFRAFQEDLEA
ncbi:MAG: hypothetical protein OXI61_15165 [Candidatus Poribacteria bacterium]|nr:hypothetical protein [Candidatus Poribacteria bacterium]